MPKCAHCGQSPSEHKYRRAGPEPERLVCADNPDRGYTETKEDRVICILRQLDSLAAREETLKQELAVLTDQPWTR